MNVGLVRTSSTWKWKARNCALAVVVMLGGEFASVVRGQSIAAGPITFSDPRDDHAAERPASARRPNRRGLAIDGVCPGGFARR